MTPTHALAAVTAALALACGSADDATDEQTGGAGGAEATAGASGVAGQGGKGGAAAGGAGAGGSLAGNGGVAGTSQGGAAGVSQGGAGGTSQGGAAGKSQGGAAGASQGGNAGTSQGGAAGNAGAGGSAQGGGGSAQGGGGSAQGGAGSGQGGGGAAGAPAGLSVAGNKLLRDGKPFSIHGVNHSGTEFACVQGWGIFDGPSDESLVLPMKAWNVNAVRVPLNEDCWLGINGVKSAYSGDAYKKAITDHVALLHQHGMVVILELHWNAPGTMPSSGQQPMADLDHAIDFWKSVATTFVDDAEVMFDLYNEPHDITWACWKSGCTTSAGMKTAGMQQLVDAVRGVGAKQPIMLGGLAYANDLSAWLTNMPKDPLKALVASHHNYNFNTCTNQACWSSTLGKVAAVVPLVTGEIGEDDCQSGYVDGFMKWADGQGIGYLAWTWNTWDCKTGPALISAYDGTPTAFGKGVRDHFLTLPLPLSG